jgi:hypothetical protein
MVKALRTAEGQALRMQEQVSQTAQVSQRRASRKRVALQRGKKKNAHMAEQVSEVQRRDSQRRNSALIAWERLLLEEELEHYRRRIPRYRASLLAEACRS